MMRFDGGDDYIQAEGRKRTDGRIYEEGCI
jgi:hypothetical protein